MAFARIVDVIDVDKHLIARIIQHVPLRTSSPKERLDHLETPSPQPGRDKPAQGIALGKQNWSALEALKGRDNEAQSGLSRPLRA